MLSLNFKPKRTAAASRGFLATARLSRYISNCSSRGQQHDDGQTNAQLRRIVGVRSSESVISRFSHENSLSPSRQPTRKRSRVVRNNARRPLGRQEQIISFGLSSLLLTDNHIRFRLTSSSAFSCRNSVLRCRQRIITSALSMFLCQTTVACTLYSATRSK